MLECYLRLLRIECLIELTYYLVLLSRSDHKTMQMMPSIQADDIYNFIWIISINTSRKAISISFLPCFFNCTQIRVSMLKKVQLKKLQKASAEEPVNSNFLSHIPAHLLKRIKPFRIVYLKSRLQDFNLSQGKHQNNGRSKVAKKW